MIDMYLKSYKGRVNAKDIEAQERYEAKLRRRDWIRKRAEKKNVGKKYRKK